MTEASSPEAKVDGANLDSAARLPATFGEKFRYLGPVVAATVLIAVAASCVLIWMVSGTIRDQVRSEAKSDLKAEVQDLRKQDAEAAKFNKVQQQAIESHQQSLAALRRENETLKKALKASFEKLVQTQERLVAASEKKIVALKDERNDVDAKQNEKIGHNSQRIVYIERKLDKLKGLETAVNNLKGNVVLKAEFKALKQDLETVSRKGDVTGKELVHLEKRARLFQLRVLAARAREAAEAARQGDLKKLLARLTEGE